MGVLTLRMDKDQGSAEHNLRKVAQQMRKRKGHFLTQREQMDMEVIDVVEYAADEITRLTTELKAWRELFPLHGYTLEGRVTRVDWS